MLLPFETINLITDKMKNEEQNLIEAPTGNSIKADVTSSGGVIRTERGWGGHFICSHRCLFRRNTLLAYNDIKIVVSTVGLMLMDYNTKTFDTIGFDRNYETMAFHADPNDKRYYDANVSRQVYFESDWAIKEQDADDRANEMHESVVAEITQRLLNGEKFETTD